MCTKSLLLIAFIALIGAPMKGRGSNTVQDQVIQAEQDCGIRCAPAHTITCPEREMSIILNVELTHERQVRTPPVSGAPTIPEVAPLPAAEPCNCTVDPRPGW